LIKTNISNHAIVFALMWNYFVALVSLTIQTKYKTTSNNKSRTINELTLQFDGSLRPPPDPNGFRVNYSIMATGAAIILSDGNILAMGGKTIDIVPCISSADIEYEGFLLGLSMYVKR